MQYEMPKTYGELHTIFTQIITGDLSFVDLDKLTLQDLELMFKIVTRHLETIEDRLKLTRNLLPDDLKPGRLNKGEVIASIHVEPYRPSDDWKIISDIWIEVSRRIDGPNWEQRVVRQMLSDREIVKYCRYLVTTGYIVCEPTQAEWMRGIVRKMGLHFPTFKKDFKNFGNAKNRGVKGSKLKTNGLQKVILCLNKYPAAKELAKRDLDSPPSIKKGT